MADTDYDQVLKAFQDQRKRRTDRRTPLHQWIFNTPIGQMLPTISGGSARPDQPHWALSPQETLLGPEGSPSVNYLRSGVAGAAGLPGDLADMWAAGMAAPPQQILPNTEAVAEALNADLESPSGIAGLFGFPDVFDALGIVAKATPLTLGVIRKGKKVVPGATDVGNSVEIAGKRYYPHKVDERSGYKVVMMDRDLVEEMTAGGEFVGPGPDYQNSIGDRIKNFEKFWSENDEIQVGDAFVDDTGYMSFGDGRHRTRVMLDSGMEQVPVSMGPEARENLAKYLRARNASTAEPVTVRVYHGTNAEFDPADMNTPAMFSTKREYAEQLAQGPGGRVIEADITLENPADLRAMNISPSDPNFPAIAEELKALGYDGAQYRDEAYIAFNPNQIRQIDQAAGEATYSGPAFRYEPGFEGGAPPGSTVGDVLAEEMSRKGVDDLEGFGIDPATYESIKDLPADAVTWVGRDANRMMQEYGPTDDWAGLLSSPDELSDVTDQVAGGRILYEDESGALILRPDAPPSKGTLSAQFLGRDDKFWDIGEDAYGQAEFRKSGHSPVSCTGYACEIQEKLGQERVTVMGFDGESNPGSAISEIADGHDFAVVDGRYIVDPWVTDVEDIGKGAYDMTDPADAAEIRRLYGDPKTWERAGPDASTQDAPAFKMTRLSVGEMKYPWAGREWDVVPAGQADLALNPGREDVVKAFGDRDVRFMVDDMQNLYVWPSDQALHGQVLDALKINRDEVELYSDQIVPASELYDWLDHWDGAGEFGSGPYQSWRPKTLDAEAAAGPGIPDDVMSMLQSNIDALGPARASMFTIADLNRAQQIYDPAHAAAEPQSRRMVDIAKDLQEEALQAWGGSPMEFTPENASIVADNMTKEAIESLKHRPDMAGWYKGNLSEAMGHASSIYPELATDPHAETAFKLIMAITSNGKEVEENAKITNRLYQQYRKTGQFPIFGSGKEKGAMEGAFRLANKLVDEWGFDEFTTFLNKEFTVRELKEAGFNISGELMDTVLNGSVIFGPKVGGGFFQNLTGNYNPATFDLWWTRTFGRHTATALHPEAKIAKQRAALREAIGRKRKFIEDLGFDPKAIKTDDEQLDELARVLNAKFAAGGHKDKNPINNASRNLMTSVGKTREAPSGGGERNFMRDVIGQVQKNLSGAGIDLDIADIQALLWYTEQDLYLKMGGKVDTTKKDYATVWKEIAEAYRAGQ